MFTMGEEIGNVVMTVTSNRQEIDGIGCVCVCDVKMGRYLIRLKIVECSFPTYTRHCSKLCSKVCSLVSCFS